MRTLKSLLAILCIAAFLSPTTVLAETGEPHNPLIDPQPISVYVTPAHNIKNILLLGIDKSDRAAAKGSDYHTDAIMVVAVNLDEGKVDLVSLPRDTLTYVPGIKGIYKLNAAINCGGGKTDQGFQTVMDAVSWVLGGIKIDCYMAVDMEAMIAIGDAIGGIDYELEMSYTGRYGKYTKGLRHLNGKGILDYLRARRNATVRSTDLGRTGRQRDMITALFEKIVSDMELTAKVIQTVAGLKDMFFTDMMVMDLADYLPLIKNLDTAKIGTHVLQGPYRTALNRWNFTFTDQANRQSVIQEVWGVDVPELKYVSYEYSKWLVDHGFKCARYISVAELLQGQIGALDAAAFSDGQKEALEAFDTSLEAIKNAFDMAADTMTTADNKALDNAGTDLRKLGDELYKLFKKQSSVKRPVWGTGLAWYADRMINEKKVNFN